MKTTRRFPTPNVLWKLLCSELCNLIGYLKGRLKSIFQTTFAHFRQLLNQFQVRAGVLGAATAQLDVQTQVVGGVGVFNGVLEADVAAFVQFVERLVEGLHAHGGRFFHHFFNAVDFAFLNHLRNNRRIEQDFHCGYAALAAFAGNQALRDEGLQVERQVGQKLGAALFGEEVDDAVKRLVGVVGVQRGETEVARFGERQGVVHGFAVANLADEDDIRRLTQGVFQRGKPVFGIHADFALGNDAFFVLMDELNRVFDGDDVVLAIFIAVVNHRSERGGFARTGTADENHEAAFFHHHVFQDGGQIEAVEIRDFAGNGAEHQRRRAALHHGIDTEAAGVGQADGEVAFVGGRKLFDLFGGHNRKSDFHTFFRGQRLVGNRRDFAVHFHSGWEIGRDKEVGAFVFVHMAQPSEQFVFCAGGIGHHDIG